jgi:hypothetical protein
MDTTQILADLRSERTRLDEAISALEVLGGGHDVPAPLGKSDPRRVAAPSVSVPAKPGRRISPEGMARIIAATKARWAKFRTQKKAAGAGAKGKSAPMAAKAVSARRMSSAAKRRLSELAKKRWAARKKQGKNKL